MKKSNQNAKKLSLKKETIAALQHIKGGKLAGETSRPTLTWVCHPPDQDPTIVKDSYLSECLHTCGLQSCGTACY